MTELEQKQVLVYVKMCGLYAVLCDICRMFHYVFVINVLLQCDVGL